jgi:hypothetical protein
MKPGGRPAVSRSGQDKDHRPGALDHALADGLAAGTLSPQEENVLAEQVARLLPFHWRLPNPMVASLSRVIAHLGGEPELLAWLDRHPGAPRVVARLYGLVDLLDQFSGEQAVVTALTELRAQAPDPPVLARYLTPDTTTATLGSLATEIELLLADDQLDTALQVGLEAAAILQWVAPRVIQLDPTVSDLGERCQRVQQLLSEAAGV